MHPQNNKEFDSGSYRGVPHRAQFQANQRPQADEQHPGHLARSSPLWPRCHSLKAYAFEELIAEIGNCLICATLGLTPDFVQSGAYIEGWLKAMKDDNRAIFKAASEAQKAMDFVLALTDGKLAVAAE